MKKLGMMLLVMCLSACGQITFKGNSYILSSSVNKMPITLAFSEKENRFFGKAVNNYFGTYEITGNQLKLSQVGSTMMMGAPDEMAAEHTYFQELSEVGAFRIADNYLVLIMKNGKELLFEKTGKFSETRIE